VDNMVYALVLASHETTANAMLLGLRRLLGQRELWDRLVADRTLVPGAVEELLRFDSPTVHHRRLAKRDTQIAGMAIPAGATIMLLLPAGNHDPLRFPDPESMDITRENAIEHLTFGKAWHFCMGAPLARFEYGLVLDRLLALTPSMELVADAQVNYLPLVLMRAPDCLMVHPDPKVQIV
jgi:cytochrome P450